MPILTNGKEESGVNMIGKLRLDLNGGIQPAHEEAGELASSDEETSAEKKVAETKQREEEDSYQEYSEEDFSESFVNDVSSSKESDEKDLDKKEFKEVLGKTKGALDAVNKVGYDNFFNKVDIDNDDTISNYELNLLNSNGQTGSVSYNNIMEAVDSMSISDTRISSGIKNAKPIIAVSAIEKRNASAQENKETKEVKDVGVGSPEKEVKAKENNTADIQNNEAAKTGNINKERTTSSPKMASYKPVSASNNINNGEAGNNEGISTISALNVQVEKLNQEKEETKEDLNENNEKYNDTQNEKEAEISNIDSEISSSKEDLGQAQNDEQSVQNEVNVAQDEVESAQEKVRQDKESVDENEANVNEANQNVQSSNQNADVKNEANQNAINEENAAQGDVNSANADLSSAINDTAAAQSTSNKASDNLAAAEGETATAFNVFNQKQAEVEEAQREYDAAQAAQNDKNWWDQFCDWVGNLWNSLTDAIQGRDASERELEEKKREEYEKRIISEEAEEALNEKREEQETAQDVADSASVVLARKTGEREVSDQEYADALLDLASSIDAKDKAEGEYSSALEEYMSANDYKVNAEGNLTDKNGQLVDIKTVVGELEDFLEIKNATKTEKESSYNQVLDTTTEVIKGDESKISSLSSEIENLQTKIQEENEKIALEEEMINQLEMERAEAEAEKEGAGFFDHVFAAFGASYNGSKNAVNEKRKLLEEALCSGDDSKIQEVYKKLNEDKEVIVDEKGNIVDTSDMSEEELEKYTTTTVGELSDKELKSYTQNEAKTAYESEKITNLLKNDGFVYNGETVSFEDIQRLLEMQADKMMSDLDDKTKQQGWISQGIGCINNALGFGTSENESRVQIQTYKEMVQDLKNCKDPAQFASKYKALTGNNFDVSAITSLLAYGEVKNSDNGTEKTKNTKTDTKANSNAIDLTETVDGIVKNVNDNADGDSDVLLQTKDSKANESIQDYVETQKALTDTVIGIAVAAVVAVTVPFTGGASLLLGAGIGAALNVGLNMSNSLYDSDGNGTTDFNYSLQQGLKDMAHGAINGLTSAPGGSLLSSKIGTKITETLGKNIVKDTAEITFKQAAKNAARKITSKVAGKMAEGAISDGLSSMGEYAFDSMVEGGASFNFGEMFAEAGQSALMGGVTNVKNKGVTSVGKMAAKKVENKVLKKTIDKSVEGVNKFANKFGDMMGENSVNEENKKSLKEADKKAVQEFKESEPKDYKLMKPINDSGYSGYTFTDDVAKKANQLAQDFEDESINSSEKKWIINQLGPNNAGKFIRIYKTLKNTELSKNDIVTIVKNNPNCSTAELVDKATKSLMEDKTSAHKGYIPDNAKSPPKAA